MMNGRKQLRAMGPFPLGRRDALMHIEALTIYGGEQEKNNNLVLFTGHNTRSDGQREQSGFGFRVYFRVPGAIFNKKQILKIAENMKKEHFKAYGVYFEPRSGSKYTFQYLHIPLKRLRRFYNV